MINGANSLISIVITLGSLKKLICEIDHIRKKWPQAITHTLQFDHCQKRLEVCVAELRGQLECNM